jgi:hypothetical protein
MRGFKTAVFWLVVIGVAALMLVVDRVIERVSH